MTASVQPGSRTSPMTGWTRSPCFSLSQARFCSTPGRLRLSRTTTSSPAANRLLARF